MSEPPARYDTIGAGYAGTRREDPHLKQLILDALGDARVVVNVGAGAGSYEPQDRIVIPVEPSSVMAAQRPMTRPVALAATAEKLPLHDRSVDAAMTVLSLHHWHRHQSKGIQEMVRVSRDRIVIVTVDPVVSGRMWLMADYLHEVRDLDLQIFPTSAQIASWANEGDESAARVDVTVVPIHRDTPDWTLMSFWAHPDRVLDAKARAATSGFARQAPAVIERVVAAVRSDLASGAWDARYGHLRELASFDAGLRLITIGSASTPFQ